MKHLLAAFKHLFGWHDFVVETYHVKGKQIGWDGRFVCSLCGKVDYYQRQIGLRYRA